ncbi:helix-turn-helix domain-containing protein [Deinococcus peraridilitoris]|uniref:Helix-turn-helix protein n=1 Tax=Deinococcus peraridilitoris (strain DSM 19664 / LMG 22246 / CIP 109416 / KR-200) TaxID=937777 RepID=L0A113_DEIPD|nr:helix-turn-helix transcriptional regulator [Deinococcus peraridilitoris]AFZ67124.1 Helix-turn-helix protein [Deinococcus peraridilitoris DSM 19664]
MTLRELREAQVDDRGKKLSGDRIAKKLGVNPATYFAWEWGNALPSGENLFKLEKILPGSMRVLMDRWEAERNEQEDVA